MKKHISAAFAVLALAACSKMAPENETVISELPEGENQQETVEPKGEGIVFQLPETKVILNGDTYQFEGTEEIVVKARSSADAVTVMTNTTTDPNIFKGVFKTSLGRKSETFDFYFNCANKTTAEKELVQNGQPWLECTGVTAKRVADDSEANYIIDESQKQKIELSELPNSITLALVSTYDCTVDFHSLSAEIPATQDKKTIAGMSITANKPYFVNINTDTEGKFKGGFYLAVNKKGETGTMYTSYGTTAPISSNQIIKINKKFEAFSGVTNLEITGFETTYSYYTDNNPATDPNSKKYSWMNEGTVRFNLSGISSSLVNLTFNNGDDNVVTVKPVKSENNNLFTYTFDSTEGYTTFGEKTLQATVSFKAGIESGKTETTTEDRYITGLPYRCDNFSNESTNWNTTSSKMTFKQEGIVFYTGSSDGQPIATFKQNFFFPNSTNVSLEGTLFKGAYTWLNKTLQNDKQLVLSIGDIQLTSKSEGSTTPSTTGFLNGNVSLKGSYNYNALNTSYEARIGNIHILYTIVR